MSAVEIRSQVDKLLDSVDESFLRVVHSMLDTHAREELKKKEEDLIVSYDAVTNTPRTSSELTAILDKEVEAVRKGDSISFEDFQKESAQWGQRTK